ncbi:putative DNA primase small subunit [Clavulina sp. PMI_390]|nr:putative DNA primase small subunit [Clavulina sp. PMI_390]
MSIDPQAYGIYYKRLMPFKSLFNWLNHNDSGNPTRLFHNREWALTVGDAYVRWNSYNSADDFKKEICRINPSRFEIGAVYSGRPRDKKTIRAALFQPVLRELVFDIDMTDYDEIRTCCSGKSICKRCWGYMASACDVLDHVLRNDFNFKHVLWVFSGRRGIHCWVSDAEAMRLTDEERKAIISYLEVVKGTGDKRVNTRFGKSTSSPHPMLGEALDILAERFPELILDDQDCFASKEGWETLLKLLPQDETDHVIRRLREKWEEEEDEGENVSSSEKWKDLRSEGKKMSKEIRRKEFLQIAMEDIILQYMYPRLDMEVTKKRNHLLKAPFCVHPDTGNICVPIDPAKVHEFDPHGVPTIHQLIEELNHIKPAESNVDGEHHSDWEQTSLRPYVQMLDKHVQPILRETHRANKGSSAQPRDLL